MSLVVAFQVSLTILVGLVIVVWGLLFRDKRLRDRQRMLVTVSGLALVSILGLCIFFLVRCLSSAGVETAHVAKIIRTMRAEIPHLERYALIDFGAGAGAFMEACAKKQVFRKVLGVELDEQLASQARSKGLDVVTGDMTTFDTRAHRPAIVYMYEPLWQLPAGEAQEIYTNVLTNLHAQGVPVVVYYGGLMETHITEALARRCGWKFQRQELVASRSLIVLAPIEAEAAQ